MSSYEAMSRYMRPSLIARTMCLLLFVLTAVLVAAGIILPHIEQPEDAVPLTQHCSTGDYVYADIAAVSDWVLRYDDSKYYTALGSDGMGYTLKLEDSVFEEMKAQHDYWCAEDENAPIPEPYRVYGHCYPLSHEDAAAMANIWQLKNAKEYYIAFGDYYINTTYSPYIELRDILWVIAIFTGLAWGMVGLVMFSKAKCFKNSRKRLERCGTFDDAALDFLSASPADKKDKLRLGRKYIFNREYGNIIPYEDVLWCYRKTAGSEIIIEIKTWTKQVYTLCVIGRSIETVDIESEEKIYKRLAEGQPEILFGYTTENALKYQEYTNIIAQATKENSKIADE